MEDLETILPKIITTAPTSSTSNVSNTQQVVSSSSQYSKPSSSSTGFVTAPSSNTSATGAVIIDIAPSTTDSEESYLDSLDEARTPLLSSQDPNRVAYDGTQDFESDDEARENEEIGFINDGDVTPRQRTASRAGNTAGDNLVDNSGVNVHSATIKIPTQNRRRIPRDRYKAFLAVLLLFFAALSNDLVLSYIHDLIPESDALPDFTFSNTPYWKWALPISEYIMLTSFSALILLTFLHRHRWVLIRRIATISALLYLGRCVTMFVTQVPKADPNYYCSPKFSPEERTFWKIFIRGLRVLTGLGLSINGKHVLCGDYIYSGHTVVHVTCYLFIREYSPRKWKILHYISALFSTIGVFCLLVSRGHYSIDVIIAYWITTRIFWQYHTMANLPVLRSSQNGRNHMTKIIWFPLFKFMESNVMRPIPRRFALPRPICFILPRRLHARVVTENDARIR